MIKSRETPASGGPNFGLRASPFYSTENLKASVERAKRGTPVENTTPFDHSHWEVSQATPEEMADFNGVQAAYEQYIADRNAWEKEINNQEIHEAYLSNIADMDLDAARRELSIVEVYMDSGILDRLHINAFNGDQKTSSLQEYLSWVYQRIEALDASAPAA